MPPRLNWQNQNKGQAFSSLSVPFPSPFIYPLERFCSSTVKKNRYNRSKEFIFALAFGQRSRCLPETGTMFKEILASAYVLVALIGYASTRPFGDIIGVGNCTAYRDQENCPTGGDPACVDTYETVNNSLCWIIDGALDAVPGDDPTCDCSTNPGSNQLPCPHSPFAPSCDTQTGCSGVPCRIPV